MTGVTSYQFFLCHCVKYTSIVVFRDKYSSACSMHEISYKFSDSHLTVYVEKSQSVPHQFGILCCKISC